MREKYQEEIEKRIEYFPMGYAFTASDFIDISDMAPTNKALSRLAENGKIRRLSKGLYDKPHFSELLNEFAAPDIESITKALSRKFNWTVAPTGETALNYLHMSTQVSNKHEYISDGPYREYSVGPYTIEFRHCANKEISGRSYITIIAIQAIKAIGKNRIYEEDKRRLANALSPEDKVIILDESKTATNWIYRILKEVCA